MAATAAVMIVGRGHIIASKNAFVSALVPQVRRLPFRSVATPSSSTYSTARCARKGPSLVMWGEGPDPSPSRRSRNIGGLGGGDRSVSTSSPAPGPSGGWDDFQPGETASPNQRRTGRVVPSRSRSPPAQRRQRRQQWDDSGEYNDDGWESNNFDDDGFDDRRRMSRGAGRGRGSRGGRGGGGRGGRGGRGRGAGGRSGRGQDSSVESVNKINLKALDRAGYVHLFGLAPVLNALAANKRDMEEPTLSGFSVGDEEDSGGEEAVDGKDEFKPEAQGKPWLFVQEEIQGRSSRSQTKAQAAKEIEELASARGVPIACVDKGVLNVLSGNRPHQGYVLRCGRLDFESISVLPHPGEDDSAPSVWLALDEVADPQNLGSLLRSAHFLGGGGAKVGILVCSKNSAPPSPVVSAASAGALELCEVYETSNLPRILKRAAEDGFRILGAAAEAPAGLTDADGNAITCTDLSSCVTKSDAPLVLVLGSEGHGLRNLVARACTGFVRIPGAAVPSAIDNDDADGLAPSAGVDSLNVGVTGAILLWHFLN